jgi:hypothetical protein
MKIYTKPSFYGLLVTGLMILYILILLYKRNETIQLIEIILLGILIGVHTLLHLGMEFVYNYNPIELIIKK